MQKERYEIAGVKYVVLDAEWAMRDELPVVKLDPVKFIPSGRVAWGGRKLGKSLKRSSHYFSLGEELSLCGKPLPENWAKKLANCSDDSDVLLSSQRIALGGCLCVVIISSFLSEI